VTDFDVLIAGAGPAGCATALSLALFAPELRVGLVDAVESGRSRIGEIVPPQINPVLAHLGVWQEFLDRGHCPSYRTLAAWGDSWLGANEFLLDVHQVGWRLDRVAFDRMLVDAASTRVVARLKSKAVALAAATGGWRVSLLNGAAYKARFLVDASGRSAVFARQRRLRPVTIDRLVGCSLRTRSRSDGTEGLIIESFADGWWYSAALYGGDRVVVCLTDADCVQPLELSSLHGFARRLAETNHMQRVAELDETTGRPQISPAVSRFFDCPATVPLLAVGDAAMCFDPVSGQGIIAALRSGIFASYAIGDWLRSGDPRVLARYRLMQQHSFASYCGTLREYYAREQRWPDNPFWQRRHRRCPSMGPSMLGLGI
jgi:2-polyprenyl-6-methoxyphenol hydroxylase-like FAD-dependent oxidoreductase